jgi:hypothetical protein
LLLLASQLPLAALLIFLTCHKFTGILVIDSDIAVASVIFAVASFHLLASLMWIASLHTVADILAAAGVSSVAGVPVAAV